jgi:hypothetical protein
MQRSFADRLRRSAMTLWQSRSFWSNQIIVPGEIRASCRAAETRVRGFRGGVMSLRQRDSLRVCEIIVLGEIGGGCGQRQESQRVENVSFRHGSPFHLCERTRF